MIKNEVIKQIQFYVRQGRMSQRKIATFWGVSRGTVQAVANGKRTDNVLSSVKTAIWVAPSGKPKRCCYCGSWVKMPCLACQLSMEQQPVGPAQE